MGDARTSVVSTTWGGGGSPFAMGSKKLGMWLFLISDALTFSALLIGYSYLRMATPSWPRPFPFYPAIAFSSLMTFCLITSSLTMVLAVRRMSTADRAGTVRWLLATMAGGALFVTLHLTEWRNLIHEGATTGSNPWGVPLFSGTFFALTGLHMLHVVAGVLYLGVIAIGVGRGRFSAEDVEVSGLYWHFVDLVWMFIFPLVYLMSVTM